MAQQDLCSQPAGISVSLNLPEWESVLNAIELAIDDRNEMAATAHDDEDAEDCAKSAEALDDLHAKISECIYGRKNKTAITLCII